MKRLLVISALFFNSCGQNNQAPTEPVAQVTELAALQTVAPTSVAVEDDHTLPPNPPSKADAEKWWYDFRAAKDKTFDSLFIKKDMAEQAKLNTEVAELNHRATELFGEPLTSKLASCTVAAIGLMAIRQDITELLRSGDLERGNPNNVAQMAWSSGEKYAECLDTMDKLK